MCAEVATCKTCGGYVDREYHNSKTQWWCQHCNKGVKPFWTETPIQKTPMETEPYNESGTYQEWQDRMNQEVRF
jgi:hypothetical protein